MAIDLLTIEKDLQCSLGIQRGHVVNHSSADILVDARNQELKKRNQMGICAISTAHEKHLLLKSLNP